MRRRLVPLVVLWPLVAAACGGHGLVVSRENETIAAEGASAESDSPVVGEGSGSSGPPVAPGGAAAPNVGTAQAGTANCATTSNPEEGFTDSTLKIGTILPLTGALRPLGQQVLRVMRLTIEDTNRENHIPGPLGHLNWGCPERPGVFGRRLELKVYSLQSTAPEEALAGMRRLIDVEKVFMVRDCYLQDSLMGPASQYQNQKGVPGVYCHFAEMPMPALAPWTFYPSTDPLTQTAIHVGYLINELDRQRLAILADPTDEDTLVKVVRQVAEYFGNPIPDDCIVLTRSQEAPNGMRSQVARIRTCYGGQSPDAVFAGDALQAVFGAIDAKNQGWRPADAGVQWSCTNPSCWVVSLAEVCGDACEDMITDCAALPCVPWADPEQYPAVLNLEDTRKELFPGEPQDAVTYGPAAITGGINLWLTMTGPDLSREKFRHTLENLRDFYSGTGPITNTSPEDHFGAKAQWMIRYTGDEPWFDDLTGGFVTIDDVGVPESLTRV